MGICFICLGRPARAHWCSTCQSEAFANLSQDEKRELSTKVLGSIWCQLLTMRKIRHLLLKLETFLFVCLFLPFFRYFLQTQQYGGWWKKEKDDQRREEGKGVRVRGPVKAGKIISGHILGEILLLSPSKLIKRHAFWAEGGGRGRNAALLPWE